jgi:hypothetical protein
VLTVLMAVGLAYLALRSAQRTGATLAGFCLALGLTVMRPVLGLALDHPTYHQWDLILHAGFMMALPTGAHLAHLLTAEGRHRWVYRALYPLVGVFGVLTLLTDWTVAGHRPSLAGPVTQPGPLLYVFALLALVTSAVYLPAVARQMSSTAVHGGVRLRPLVLGLLGCVLLCFGDLLAGAGLLPVLTSPFAFLPLAAMGYSVLHADLGVTTKGVMSRGLAQDVAFGLLLVVTALVVSALPWLFAGQPREQLLERLFPNALPAALSTLICFAIAFGTFAWGASSLGALLFGVMCAMWGFYCADLAIVSVIEDGTKALWVSRFDHLCLTINLPVSFHVCLVFAGASSRRLLTLSYGLALATLPFVLTPLYIPYMHRYWFGYFAAAGPVMHVHFTIQIGLIAYGLLLLWRARRSHPDERGRNLARYMFTGVLGAFVLCLGALPGINGIPLYPPAQFLFAPFVIMASGILVTRAVSFRSFLRIGLARVGVTLLFLLIVAVALVSITDRMEGFQLWATVGVICLVGVVIFVPISRSLLRWLKDLIEPGREGREARFRTLGRRLAQERDPEEVATRIVRELAQVMELESACVLLGDGAQLHGVQVHQGVRSPVLLWSDDPLIETTFRRAALVPEPEVPAIREGELFRVLPGLRLVLPVVYHGRAVGLLAVGPRADGRAHDQAAWDWLGAMGEAVAPHVLIATQARGGAPRALDPLVPDLPSRPRMVEEDPAVPTLDRVPVPGRLPALVLPDPGRASQASVAPLPVRNTPRKVEPVVLPHRGQESTTPGPADGSTEDTRPAGGPLPPGRKR